MFPTASSQVALVVKKPPANAGDARDAGHKRCGLDPWVGKIPGEGNGNPLQYSCLENSMDRGAWQASWPWGHEESTILALSN